jgi:hypothetical protein
MNKTIFEGTINGEKFNSVQEYNSKMLELISAGEPVDASSRTRSVSEKVCGTSRCVCDKSVKTPEEKLFEAICNAKDEDILLPYFEDDEPYYLDELVGNDEDENNMILENVHDYLDTAWEDIIEYLNSNHCKSEKKDYLNDIHDIITNIKRDRKTNNEAFIKLKKEREEAKRVLEEANAEYESAMEHCDSLETVLVGASRVIEDLLGFYKNVEAEGIRIVKECEQSGCCGECENVETECKESKPQAELDLTKLDLSEITDLSSAFDEVLNGVFKNVDMNRLKNIIKNLKV